MNNDKIILRNIKEQDIEDYVKWLTDKKYSEWLNWDAPWEHEDSFDADEERRRWTKFFEASEALDSSKLRHRFEIEVNDKHVGWVSAYDDLGYMENPDKHLAIGIDIPEMDVWGRELEPRRYSCLLTIIENREKRFFTFKPGLEMRECSRL